MLAVRDGNPFPKAASNRVMTIFLDTPADKATFTGSQAIKTSKSRWG